MSAHYVTRGDGMNALAQAPASIQASTTCQSNLDLHPHESTTNWAFSPGHRFLVNDQDGIATYPLSQEFAIPNGLIASNISSAQKDAESFGGREHGHNIDKYISGTYNPVSHNLIGWANPNETRVPYRSLSQNSDDLKFLAGWMSFLVDDITVANSTVACSDDHSTGEGSTHHADTASRGVHHQPSLIEKFDFSQAGESPPGIPTKYVANPAKDHSDGALPTHNPSEHLDYNAFYHNAQSHAPASTQHQPVFHSRRSHIPVREISKAHISLEDSSEVDMTQSVSAAATYPFDPITGSATPQHGVSGSIDYQSRSNYLHSTNKHPSMHNNYTGPLVHEAEESPAASGHLLDETYTSSNSNYPIAFATSSNDAADPADQHLLTQQFPDLQPHHLSRLQKCAPRHLKTYLNKCRPGDRCPLVLKTIAAVLSIDAEKIDKCDDDQLSRLLLTLCEQRLYVLETGGPRKGVTAARCAFTECKKSFGENNRIRNLMHHVIYSHLQLEPFICAIPGCDTAFPWPDDRTRHEKSLHSYSYTS